MISGGDCGFGYSIVFQIGVTRGLGVTRFDTGGKAEYSDMCMTVPYAASQPTLGFNSRILQQD